YVLPGGCMDLLGVMLVCFMCQQVHLVLEQLVPDDVPLRPTQSFIFQCLLDPLFQSVHPHDRSVCAFLLEVGVFHAIACVGEGDPCSVGSELFHRLTQSQEVAS